MKTCNVKVSVVTAAYNRASLLDETILSVLNQDYPKVEYIVLDDGSTDHTLEVIKKYGQKLIWDSHSNMGETRTVNKGFSMSTGDIIGVVSSDDPLLPGAISTAVEHLTRNPELVVVYPDWLMIDGNGKTVEHIKTFDYSYVNMLRRHHCMPGPGTFFRRAVVETLQGRDSNFRYVADFDFWLRAGLLGPFARIPETLASFRLHPGSASVKERGTSMANEHVQLVKKIYSLPNLPPEVVKVKREAFSSAYYIAGMECADGSVGLRKGLYLRSFLYSPIKYFGEYRGRLRIILPIISGVFYKLLVQAWRASNWIRDKLRRGLKASR